MPPEYVEEVGILKRHALHSSHRDEAGLQYAKSTVIHCPVIVRCLLYCCRGGLRFVNRMEKSQVSAALRVPAIVWGQFQDTITSVSVVPARTWSLDQ
jgi:hypothetical protein